VCSDCNTATTGLEPDASSRGYNDNQLKCSCPITSLSVFGDCSYESLLQGNCPEISCSRCPSSQTASLDQSQCVPCSIAEDTNHYEFSFFDADTNQCKCQNPPKAMPTGKSVINKRLVEVYDEGTGLPTKYECMRCADGKAVITSDLYEDGHNYLSTAGAKYTADPTICVSCPDPQMYFDTDYSCKCAEGFLMTGEASVGVQSCIERYPTIASDYSKAAFISPVIAGGAEPRVDFTLDSITFSHYYLMAASQCEYFQHVSGLTACQILGNLCVMNNYDVGSAPCKQFLAVSQRRSKTYHTQEEWKQTLPWLYYSGEGNDVINDNGIKMKMAFNAEANAATTLSFKLAKYRLDGSFVGIEDLSDQFKFCSDSTDNNNVEWKSFGKGYRVEMSCNIKTLLKKQMHLYDMYVVDTGVEACKGNQNDSECLYPVPVLNRNFMKSGGFPNMNVNVEDEANDQYTRRFFLFDNKVSCFYV
jgi:meckelin